MESFSELAGNLDYRIQKLTNLVFWLRSRATLKFPKCQYTLYEGRQENGELRLPLSSQAFQKSRKNRASVGGCGNGMQIEVAMTPAAGVLKSPLFWILFLSSSRLSGQHSVRALAPVDPLLPPASSLVQGFLLVQALSHLRPHGVTRFLCLLSTKAALIVAYHFPVLFPEKKSLRIFVCLFVILIF